MLCHIQQVFTNLLLLGSLAGSSQAAGCDCLAAAPGIAAGASITVHIAGHGSFDYGPAYGLHACAAHDVDREPFCQTAYSMSQSTVPVDVPAWCSADWCYVNSTTCASAAASAYVTGAFYSYAACGSANTFSGFYSELGGTVRLCSVFSAKDAALDETGAAAVSTGPCGNTATHVQVDAMVRWINTLHGGRGFPLEMGRPSRPVYLRLSYNWTTYPYGEWEAVGHNLSLRTFTSGKCDLVIGMAHGCPDPEIMQQAVLANVTQKIYVTARGPRQVLTQYGAHQPFFFSSHLRSDIYAGPGLKQAHLEGARTIAIVMEDYGNYFFRGLGLTTVELAQAEGYTVRLSESLCRPDAPSCGMAGTAIDEAALRSHLDAAVASRADVLALVVRGTEFKLALAHLKARRAYANDTAAFRVADGAHVFQSLWWQGMVWKNASGAECLGNGLQCDHVLGAGQMGSTESETYVDSLVGASYLDLQASPHWAAAGGDVGSLLSSYADGAMIPSTFAQALQSVFRFRELADASQPLSSPADYEVLRAYLASGEQVAQTMYGPVRFDEKGANAGRDPTTFQFVTSVADGGENGTRTMLPDGGKAKVILPQVHAETTFVFPSPGSIACGDSSWVIADAPDTCVLCAPAVCHAAAPPPPRSDTPHASQPAPNTTQDIVIACLIFAAIVLLLLCAVLAWRQYREEHFLTSQQLHQILEGVHDGEKRRYLMASEGTRKSLQQQNRQARWRLFSSRGSAASSGELSSRGSATSSAEPETSATMVEVASASSDGAGTSEKSFFRTSARGAPRVSQAEPSLSVKIGRFGGNANDLIMGKPEKAAFGLYHFMRVPDPFATEGVELIVQEVEDYVAKVKRVLRDAGYSVEGENDDEGGSAVPTPAAAPPTSAAPVQVSARSQRRSERRKVSSRRGGRAVVAVEDVQLHGERVEPADAPPAAPEEVGHPPPPSAPPSPPHEACAPRPISRERSGRATLQRDIGLVATLQAVAKTTVQTVQATTAKTVQTVQTTTAKTVQTVQATTQAVQGLGGRRPGNVDKNATAAADSSRRSARMRWSSLRGATFMMTAGKLWDSAADVADDLFAEYRELLAVPPHKELTARMIIDALEEDLLGNLHYVLHEPASRKECPNGTRDEGNEGKTLQSFCTHPIAARAELSRAHVVALRLYTTPAYRWMNHPLRDTQRYYERYRAHPLPATLAYIESAIKKLRVVAEAQARGNDHDGGGAASADDQPASPTKPASPKPASPTKRKDQGKASRSATTLWRGMRNLRVLPETEKMGGTELAPMSTTTDLRVATSYSLHGNGSLLLKLKVSNFMQMGANLKWISAFPNEAEVLFPPLTYLHPTGRKQHIVVGKYSFDVLEFEPHLP